MSPFPLLNPDILMKKVGPLPVWGYLGIGVGALYLLRKRAGSDEGFPTGDVGTGYVPRPTAGGAGGAGGSKQPGNAPAQPYITATSAFPTSGQAQTSQTAGNQAGPISQQSSMMAVPNSGSPAYQQLSEYQRTSIGIPEQQSIIPNKLAMLQANQFDQSVVNPVGSADAAAAQTYYGDRTYFPSQLDYLTEQPGGLNYRTTATGATVYQAQIGSGPVVAPQDQKPGERYDMSGRVIL